MHSIPAGLRGMMIEFVFVSNVFSYLNAGENASRGKDWSCTNHWTILFSLLTYNTSFVMVALLGFGGVLNVMCT